MKPEALGSSLIASLPSAAHQIAQSENCALVQVAIGKLKSSSANSRISTQSGAAFCAAWPRSDPQNPSATYRSIPSVKFSRWNRTRSLRTARPKGYRLLCLDQPLHQERRTLFFDRQSLELLLQSSRPILSASRWPLDPDQVVGRIAREWIDPGYPVAPVIKRAFGEVAS